MPPNPENRFLNKVRKETGKDGCWIWTASKNQYGYGQFSLQGKIYGAHRVAFSWWVRPVTDDETIDHLCRVRACVRPSHLEAVSNKENILRGVGFGAKNARKTHCPAGHEYDGTCSRGYRTCSICRAISSRRHNQKVNH